MQVKQQNSQQQINQALLQAFIEKLYEDSRTEELAAHKEKQRRKLALLQRSEDERQEMVIIEAIFHRLAQEHI